MRFDIIGRRFQFFAISGAIILIGIISLATFGLPRGIEFSSGSILTVKFEQEVEQKQLEQELADLGYSDAIVQQTGAGDYLIRTKLLSDEEKQQLETELEAKFGQLSEAQFSAVSPQAAAETVRNAVIAVIIASIGILLYVTVYLKTFVSSLKRGHLTLYSNPNLLFCHVYQPYVCVDVS